MIGGRAVFDEVPGLRELAQSEYGVLRRDQLLVLGITWRHIQNHVRAGRWRTIGPVVVVLSTGPLSRVQRMQVACAHAGPHSFLDGRTALERFSLSGWFNPDLEVVVPHGSLPGRLSGVVVHQSRHLDEIDLRRTPAPRCVSPARAAIDAAGREASPRSAAALVLAVAQQRLATPAEMLDVLSRIWRVRHTAVIREALSSASDGADSLSENDVLRLMRAVGLRDIRRQVPITTPLGTFPVDFLVQLRDGRRLVVEVDGPSHDDPRQRLKDQERDAALLSLGYVVLRIPVALLRADPAAVREQLRTIWMSSTPKGSLWMPENHL
ncbi:MAG: endonuclease domain-containing protein [Candidatus Nanopelagicales bacterium]